MNNKILIIGLDGATFDLIGTWAKDGRPAVIEKLISCGIHGDLELTMPPMIVPFCFLRPWPMACQ